MLEIILSILGGFFEVFGEFLLQLILELLLEVGGHSFSKPDSQPTRGPLNPWLAALVYVGFGVIAGALSLLLFPAHFLKGESSRIINLIATPFAAGLAMSALGAWRSRRGQIVLRIDRFTYGTLFALALAVVRFLYAK